MDKLCVIQADRDAAAALSRALAPWLDGMWDGQYKSGDRDEWPVVQALAAHRIASQAELVEALTEIEHAESVEVARRIARAALSHTKGEGE